MKQIFFLAVFYFAATVYAQEGRKPQCTEYASKHLGKNVGFCVHRSAPQLAQKQEPVVYFFHGLGGDSSTWDENGYSDAFEKLALEGTGFPPATIISFDTDVDSFFSDYAGNPEGERAYETWFVKEFVPHIEKTYEVCGERKCRATAGLSMGGFGALKTALKYPEMFFSAAANSPALPPFSIHEPTQLWRDYFARHPIGVLKGMFLLGRIKNIFPTPEEYNANDPINLIKNFRADRPIPNLYFDMGGKDDFGFQEGFAVLKTALDAKNIKYTSYLEPDADHSLFKKRNIDALRFLRDRLLHGRDLN